MTSLPPGISGAASELLSQIGQAPTAAPPPASAPVGGPPDVAQGGGLPPSAEVPSSAPGPSDMPGQLPVLNNPQEVIDTFYRIHGRTPGQHEVRAIRALPILARQLGRRPTKTEMLAFLDGRRENPPNQKEQFEVLSGPTPGAAN